MPRALHKKSWAVIDRPYSLGCATVGALYERPRCIFCAKPMQREATRAFPRFVQKSKDDLAICVMVELNSLDDLELQLQRETQHARVCNRRRLAADSSWQVGRDLDSERLTFGKDCICIDDIENRALC